MRTRTNKRAKQERKYSEKRRAFIASKPHYCFFCGHYVGNPDIHHLVGRDGDRLLDEDNWVLAHRECHTAYHSQSWRKLPWWEDYLYRLKIKNPAVYYDEMMKMSK